MNKNLLQFASISALILMTGCNGASQPAPSSSPVNSSSSLNASVSSAVASSAIPVSSSSITPASSSMLASSSSLPPSLPSSSAPASSSSVAPSSSAPSSQSSMAMSSSSSANSTDQPIGPNLVPNGNFAQDPNKPGAKWVVVNQNMTQSDLDWVEKSAVLTVSAISDNWWETTFYSPPFTLTKGKKYRVSAKFNAVNNSTEKVMRFRVRYSGGAPFGTNIGEFTVSETPTVKTFTLQVPNNAPNNNIQAQLLFNLGADENDVKIDNVSVYELGTPETNFEITSHKDIRYSQRFQRNSIADYPANHSPNVLDIYRPDNNNVYPGLVLVHGGAWRFPGKNKLETTAKELAAKGYVVANIHYQLSTPTTKSFPEAIIDVKSAIRWFRGNAQTYNLNPNKIAGIGGSAGGNLIAMAATTSEKNNFDGPANTYSNISDQLQATIVLAGGMDQEYRLRVTDPSAANSQYVKSYFGITGSSININNNKHLNLLRQGSPIQHANNKMGPILLIESGGDVPNAPQGRYGDPLFDKLNTLGITNEYKRITNAKHSKWDSEAPTRAAYMKEYNRFLKQHLK